MPILNMVVLVPLLLTALSLWRSASKALRLIAVMVNLMLLGRCYIMLANVGRNTFEHVEKTRHQSDSFREGVFAEAKAADAFSRNQLPTVYVITFCIGAMAIWPALARRE